MSVTTLLWNIATDGGPLAVVFWLDVALLGAIAALAHTHERQLREIRRLRKLGYL